jgi:hypothetical protein
MVKDNPATLSIAIPPLVPSEWIDNQSQTCKEVENFLTKLDNKIKVAMVCARAFNQAPKLTRFSNLELHVELSNLSKQILYSGTWIKSEDGVQVRAATCTPPARKGAVKDCIIYEHCIELFRLLRKDDFLKRCIFLTSNTTDYSPRNNSGSQNPIPTEMEQLCANLATNWEWTLHLLDDREIVGEENTGT